MTKDIIICLISYVAGIAISAIIFHPVRNFSKGYGEGLKASSNYDEGFADGWDGAVKAMRQVCKTWLNRAKEKKDGC